MITDYEIAKQLNEDIIIKNVIEELTRKEHLKTHYSPRVQRIYDKLHLKHSQVYTKGE